MKNPRKPYAQRLIPLIIFAVVSYTVADILLQIFKNVEISSTLTTCWFGFWGIEIINLAAIKYSKVKKPKIKQSSEFGQLDIDQLNTEV
jgi:hypothetical protein